MKITNFTCQHCGGTNIIKNIPTGWGDGCVLLHKKTTTSSGGLSEKIYADLCGDCGTIVRWFVLDPKKIWHQYTDVK